MELGGSCKFWQLLSKIMTGDLTAWLILAKMCGVMQIRATIAHSSSKALTQRGLGGAHSHTLHKHTYLDKGFTMIKEVVPPGRGWSIALRIWLTPAISTNVGNSVSQFLLVGNCVRANRYIFKFYHHLLPLSLQLKRRWNSSKTFQNCVQEQT